MMKPARHPRWTLASQHPRPFQLDRLELSGLFLRLTAVGLLSRVIWIHLHLWLEGYRHIPTIGPLFLVGGFSALAVSAVLLVWPSRLVGLLGLGVDAGILTSLIASINVGLFGFKESLTGPFVVESIVIEAVAAVALAAWVFVDLAAENRSHPKVVSSLRVETEATDAELCRRRARQAETDADELARALDFHIVNECDCHGAADVATLRRHDIRVVTRHMNIRDQDRTPAAREVRPALIRPRRAHA